MQDTSSWTYQELQQKYEKLQERFRALHDRFDTQLEEKISNSANEWQAIISKQSTQIEILERELASVRLLKLT